METPREIKACDNQELRQAKAVPALVLGVTVGILASRSLGKAAAIGALVYAFHRLTADKPRTKSIQNTPENSEREIPGHGLAGSGDVLSEVAASPEARPEILPGDALFEIDVAETMESSGLTAFTLWLRDSPGQIIVKLKEPETSVLPADRQQALTKLRRLNATPPNKGYASPFTLWIKRGDLIPVPCTLVQAGSERTNVPIPGSIPRPPPITPVEVRSETIDRSKFEPEPYVSLSLPTSPVLPQLNIEPKVVSDHVEPLPPPPVSKVSPAISGGKIERITTDVSINEDEPERGYKHSLTKPSIPTGVRAKDSSAGKDRRRLKPVQTPLPVTQKDFPILPFFLLVVMVAGIMFGLSYFIKVAGLPETDPSTLEKEIQPRAEPERVGPVGSNNSFLETGRSPEMPSEPSAERLLDADAHISRATKDLKAFLSSFGDEEKAFVSLDAKGESRRAAFRAIHGPKRALIPTKVLPLRKDAERSDFETVPFSVDLASGETVSAFLYLDKNSGRFKTDWDLWVQCRFNLLEEFRKKNDSSEADFCVNLKRGHSEDRRLKEHSHLLWCIVTPPGSGIAFHAVAAPNSPGATQVKDIGWQSEQRVRITAHMDQMEGVSVMKITRIVPDAWGS